jgi:hypothetical protein
LPASRIFSIISILFNILVSRLPFSVASTRISANRLPVEIGSDSRFSPSQIHLCCGYSRLNHQFVITTLYSSMYLLLRRLLTSWHLVKRNQTKTSPGNSIILQSNPDTSTY